MADLEPLLPGSHLFAHRFPSLARVLDRASVLDRRDVARILVESDGLQYAAHDLATAGFGKGRDEIEVTDHGHRAEFAAHGLEQLLAQLFRRFIALLEDDEGRD